MVGGTLANNPVGVDVGPEVHGVLSAAALLNPDPVTTTLVPAEPVVGFRMIRGLTVNGENAAESTPGELAVTVIE